MKEKPNKSSGQFGDSLIFSVVVSILASIILIRVDRWIISLSFIVGYIILQYNLLIYYDPTLSIDMIYRRFYSISLMLFIYFMLTDPAITPSKKGHQALFGFALALTISLLDRYYGFRVQHLFILYYFLLLLPFSPVIFKVPRTWLGRRLLLPFFHSY